MLKALCATAAVCIVGFSTGPASAHDADEARHELHRRGYYDVRIERTSLPYSFNACKRGLRFHIHVGYYGELVEKDAIGPCERDDYGYYGQRRYPDRPRYWRGY